MLEEITKEFSQMNARKFNSYWGTSPNIGIICSQRLFGMLLGVHVMENLWKSLESIDIFSNSFTNWGFGIFDRSMLLKSEMFGGVVALGIELKILGDFDGGKWK